MLDGIDRVFNDHHKRSRVRRDRASRTRLEIHGVDCFTVREGKVVQNIIVFDQLSFARKIGLLPPEGSLIDQMGLKLYNLRTRLEKQLRRG